VKNCESSAYVIGIDQGRCSLVEIDQWLFTQCLTQTVGAVVSACHSCMNSVVILFSISLNKIFTAIHARVVRDIVLDSMDYSCKCDMGLQQSSEKSIAT